ncbi:hypothetical protein QU836_25835, partial [Escherichia coli]|nr:hypothetical protein [Escherichia coli]
TVSMTTQKNLITKSLRVQLHPAFGIPLFFGIAFPFFFIDTFSPIPNSAQKKNPTNVLPYSLGGNQQVYHKIKPF